MTLNWQEGSDEAVTSFRQGRSNLGGWDTKGKRKLVELIARSQCQSR
jgi:hypothetical protein